MQTKTRGGLDAPLETIETYREAEASVRRLFGGEGRRIAGGSIERERRVAELLEIVAEAQSGSLRAQYVLRETMTTDDFPLLFGDVMARQLVAGWQEAPVTYPAYVSVTEVPDFRPVSRFAIDGAEGVLEDVAEQGEYPEAALTEARDQFSVGKKGRRIPLSWETIVNDDLGAFRNIPTRLGRAARRTEERFATELFVDASGPHASLYTVGNANIVTGNPPLSESALVTAMGVLSAMRDEDGEPIVITSRVLVVPPALEFTARKLLEATELRIADGSNTLVVPNWLRGTTQLVINHYIPVIATSNGDTSWFLFAGADGSSRTALTMAFLRGYREPQIFVKEPNARRVGGGSDPLDGDFDTDSVEYKVRHVMGGTRLLQTGGFRATVASIGDGSS